ncbi:MAG: cation:proton antiporter [Deferribacteraceae bacterium]|jgi:Kef-type K+ transport system membrane component KefB|nr:cation:proton antiporter [Deferribacteraceae bacterium]
MEKTDALRLLVIAFGAYIMPFVSRRLMLPSAAGEFLFGMTIGSLFMEPGYSDGFIRYLSVIGFLLLMYIAGLELDLDRIAALRKKQFFAYGSYAVILVAGAFIMARIINMPPFFALIIMCSAIGLLFSVMKDLNIVKTALGQMLLLLGVIGEVLTLAGITVVSLIARTGDAQNIARQIIGIIIFITSIFFIMKVLKLFLWWYPEMNRFFMSVGNPSEIGVRANLVNMFLFAAIAAVVNIEAILGAFLGGVIFARLFADREEMLERLSSFGYGFLIPVFFIDVGSRFRFSDFTVPGVLEGAVLITASILIVRAAAAIPLLWTHTPRRQLIYVPFAESFALTLFVAATATGEKAGVIEHSQASMVILTAVITAIFFPWIMKLLYKFMPVMK